MTALERLMAADAVALSKEHADRADAAEARAVAAEAKLEAAEARLAIAVRALSGIRAVVGTSTEAYHMARDALAIIGTEEEKGDAGDDWSFTEPAL